MTRATTLRVGVSRAFGPGSRRVRPTLLGSLLIAGAVALAGCGSSSQTTSSQTTPSQTSSTPTTTAAAGYPKPPKISAKLRAQEVAVHRQVIAALHAPVPKTVKPGVIPKFIPRSTLKVGRIVTASRGHTQLAIQGDSLRVKLAHASVITTVTGPFVPIRYSGTNDPIVPGSFVLTFSRAHGHIPLDASDFHITDALGTGLFPSVNVRGGGEIPTAIPTNRKLTLVFHDRLPIGQGYFEYNPFGTLIPKGKRPIANWDLDVESD